MCERWEYECKFIEHHVQMHHLPFLFISFVFCIQFLAFNYKSYDICLYSFIFAIFLSNHWWFGIAHFFGLCSYSYVVSNWQIQIAGEIKHLWIGCCYAQCINSQSFARNTMKMHCIYPLPGEWVMSQTREIIILKTNI